MKTKIAHTLDSSKICDALGNETRFQIVMSLRKNSINTCCDKIEYHESGGSVTDMVKTTGLAQSTISQHLKVLENAGIISKEKRGSWTCFFLNDGLIRDFLDQLETQLTTK
jgi:DNA-binding transcriptional ArsR family regulator